MSPSNSIVYRLATDREQLRVVLFSLFAFCVLAVSVTFFSLSIGKPYMGIRLAMNDLGWAVQSIDANGHAIQAGIRVGDRPIEINGHPADTFFERYEANGVVFGLLIKELTVVDDRGQLKTVALKDDPQSWPSVIELATWFAVSLISWITGFYVFFKRPRSAAALLLCLCGLAFGLALSGNLAGERAIPTASWLAIAAAIIGPWLLLHFFLVLPEERTWVHGNPRVYLIYLPAAVTLVLFPLLGWADGQSLPWFRTVRLLEYGVGLVAAAGVATLNYFGTVSPRTRQQMRIVLIGCLAALIPVLVLYILPEAIWGESILPSGLSILLIAFIPLSMGYAVVTKKLMDIDVIIRRGVIYGLIAVVMAAVLSAAIVPLLAFEGSLGLPEEIGIALALGAMATILFGPTKRAVENLVDKLFYRDRYDYRKTITGLSSSLNSLTDLVDI